MNTPAHLIFGLTAFGKPAVSGTTTAALAGAILPDLSLYLLASWHLFVLQTPAHTVFGELYYSNAWQNIFRIDNSFVLWGAGLIFALVRRNAIAIAFCGAAVLHLALDFPLHHDDARSHFWPITNWVFHSPVSYWDPRHHGFWVGITEITACLICVIILWRRYTHWPIRVLSSTLMLMELAPVFAWIFGDFGEVP